VGESLREGMMPYCCDHSPCDHEDEIERVKEKLTERPQEEWAEFGEKVLAAQSSEEVMELTSEFVRRST
jgi:phosphoenolpyruvate-protein kinase (PTS system EI component)